MPSKIRGKHLDEISAKMVKKWKKNCEAKHGVVEKSQNQNGVVFFSNVKSVANHYSGKVGHRQYWIFTTNVSIL